MVTSAGPATPEAAPPPATALAGAGLELACEPAADGGLAYVVRGDTFAHRAELKARGGRWSQSRHGWVFSQLAALAGLLPAAGDELATPRTPGLAEAPAPFVPARPHYLGHRQRLRDRFMAADPEALPDYELLELLLFFSIAKIDVKPLAKQLLAEFGSLGGVLAADPQRLAAIGLSQFTIVQLRASQALLQRVLRETVQDRPLIGSGPALLAYLQVALGHAPIEQFRVLFLDRKNLLIKDELQQRGTVDHTPVYPREIAKRALELAASAVIMVHNHPSGDPTPSPADRDMTRQVASALAAVGVALHDHLIIGQNRHLSFRSDGLL